MRVSLQASCILLMVIPILITCVSTAIVHRQFLFDDSFITYRYAKNLADGNGIVFNPGDPPTEGYTPLLLVLLLAPFLKIGLDPLVITRVLSFLSAIGLSACIFFSAKRRFRCTTISASIVASIPFLFSDTVVHCMTGMETMLYTLCLFLCFLAGVQFIRNQSLKWSLIFSSILFLCTLFRPEGFLLYIAFLILCGIQALRKDSILLRPLIAGAGLLFAMGMVYGIWKVFHFGYILPNAFFIKANTPFFFSEMGVASVVDFLVHYSILLALVLSSAILAGTQEDFLPRESNKVLIWGSIFVTLYVIFFATVDTLQDIGGRFLYPCMAILVLLSMPSLVRVIDWMTSDSILKGSATIGACIMVYLVFQPIYLFQLITNTKQMIYYGMRGGGIDDPYSLVQREMQIGKDLAEYPDISRIRLMVGDAGVIPYFSEAICLDPVGLNDTFIARNRDPQALSDYVYGWEADVIIGAINKDFTWLQIGHGPMGNLDYYARDIRADEYFYVGTCRTRDSYDLFFFVRKSSKYLHSLTYFLRERVVDGWYNILPVPLGSYVPKKDIQLEWTMGKRVGLQERSTLHRMP